MDELMPFCPRCLDLIPVVPDTGRLMSATSRVDDETDICGPCGSDEAMRLHETAIVVPMSQWPLDRKEAHAFVPHTPGINA